MTFIRKARFMLKLLVWAGLAFYLVLNFHGFVFFGKSVKLWSEDKYRAAAVADQIVTGKYPFSPLAPLSRAMLGLKIHTNHLQESDLITSFQPIQQSRYTRQWSPLQVDGFTLLCLSFYLACGLGFLLLHENRHRSGEVWGHLGKASVFFGLYCAWIHLATGNQIFGFSLQLSFFANSLLALGWALLGVLLVIQSFLLIKSSNVALSAIGNPACWSRIQGDGHRESLPLPLPVSFSWSFSWERQSMKSLI